FPPEPCVSGGMHSRLNRSAFSNAHKPCLEVSKAAEEISESVIALPSSPLFPNGVEEASSIIGSTPAGGTPLGGSGRDAGTVPLTRTSFDSCASTLVANRLCPLSVERLRKLSLAPVIVSR